MHEGQRLGRYIFALTVLQQMCFAALAPLVPSVTEELGLSGNQVALLVGSFSIAMGVIALPIALLASRLGVARIVATGVVVVASGSVLFGSAHQYETLLIARLIQGAGAGLCWAGGLAWLVGTASRARRGEMIGWFSSGSAAGHLVGAMVGGIAILVGRIGTFGIAALTIGIVGAQGRRFPSPELSYRAQSLRLLWRAHHSWRVAGGLFLVTLPGLLSGVAFALGPLELARLGMGGIGIGMTFLGAAALGVITRRRVGRWSDRIGALKSIQILLVASLVLAILLAWLDGRYGLSACLICAIAIFGVLQGPAMALLSERYEDSGLALVVGFGLMAFQLGCGFFLGSVLAGAISAATNEDAAYLTAAGFCVLGFATASALATPEQIASIESEIRLTGELAE